MNRSLIFCCILNNSLMIIFCKLLIIWRTMSTTYWFVRTCNNFLVLICRFIDPQKCPSPHHHHHHHHRHYQHHHHYHHHHHLLLLFRHHHHILLCGGGDVMAVCLDALWDHSVAWTGALHLLKFMMMMIMIRWISRGGALHWLKIVILMVIIIIVLQKRSFCFDNNNG